MLFTAKKLLLFFATIAFSQHLTHAQQQPTGTASAADPVPTFQNTFGLQVQAPRNGVSIRPDGSLPIALTLGRRLISSVLVTVAKADGSGNTTVLEYRAVTAIRIMTVAPLAAFKFSEGDYIVNLAITPNLTAVIPTYTPPPSSGNATAATITVAPAPNPTAPVNLPGVYYWRGALKLSNDAPVVNGNGGGDGTGASNNAAPSAGVGAGGVMMMTGAWAAFANMMTALGVLAFVNIIML
ncbi:hypothetical protein BG015_011041 [Linnemannia schmuckeri]|uniref:Uncharacterized protein n=1 Tax=Linnemannia schmuckeri TaxID=64567 RepID=A0A9P5RTN4_9FUNG|nr:hypothetical protein BG015_011041 [Linnemannia schmuckeri]